MNLSVSEEMYSLIRRRTRERYHSSVSEYIRSLVRQDQLDTSAVRETFPKPRRANDYFLEVMEPDEGI